MTNQQTTTATESHTTQVGNVITTVTTITTVTVLEAVEPKAIVDSSSLLGEGMTEAELLEVYLPALTKATTAAEFYDTKIEIDVKYFLSPARLKGYKGDEKTAHGMYALDILKSIKRSGFSKLLYEIAKLEYRFRPISTAKAEKEWKAELNKLKVLAEAY